ncbi:MAG: hypothetical protein DRO87_10790 [Candidatus Thorarchaeota archaeon]|nr:MAG: hypothetical protein DRO87_10790 [Candidatus Thorarchaeota archaeon]
MISELKGWRQKVTTDRRRSFIGRLKSLFLQRGERDTGVSGRGEHDSRTVTMGLARAILNALTVPVVVVDARRMKILVMNREAQTTYYDRRGPFCPHIVDDIIRPCSDRDCVLLEAKKSGHQTTVERTVVDKGGHVRHEIVRITPIESAAGSHHLLVVTLQDVTRLRHVERNLESALRQAKLYVDVMKHDIRNRLQALLSAVELMKIGPHDLDSLNSLVSIVEDAALATKSLIDKSRIVGAHHGVVKPWVILRHLLEDAVQNLGKRYPDVIVGLGLRSEVSDVLVDPSLAEALDLILDNAVVHNPKIQRWVGVDVTLTNGEYLVTVTDNGSGLSDKMKATVLDPNRRLRGIGLHQAQEILSRLGGSVTMSDRIESEPRMGLRVILTIPAASTRPVEEFLHNTDPSPHSGRGSDFVSGATGNGEHSAPKQ